MSSFDRDADKSVDHLVTVIRWTNHIEGLMKSVIAAYLAVPDSRVEFLSSHVLNNAITPFAAKVKLVLAVARQVGHAIDRDALHTILSRRNGFAHQDHFQSVRLVQDDHGHPDAAFVLESVSGSGALETVTQESAFNQFVAAYLRAEADLLSLQAQLKGAGAA